MRKHRLITIVLALLVLTFAVVSVSAYDFNFYDGDLSITSLDVVVDASDNSQMTATYVVKNDGSSVVNVALSTMPDGAELKINGVAVGATTSFTAGQQRTVITTYTKAPAGDGNLKVLRIAPELFFDGGMYAGTVDDYEIRVTLPSGIPSLAASSRQPTSWTSSSGRTVAVWESTDAYPTSLTVQWNTLGANIVVSASADTDTVTVAGQQVTVDVIVENRGTAALQDIELECSFTPSDFEGVEPASAFEEIEPEGSDPRLIWSESIASLGAGQSQTVSFTMSVLNAAVNISLEPIRVTVGGELVGTSDHVFFEVNLTGIVQTPTPSETTTTAGTTQTPGMGLFTVMTALGLLIIVMSRKR